LIVTKDTGLTAIRRWFHDAEAHALYIAIDTEYVPDTQMLTIIGVGYQWAPAGGPGRINGIQLQWIGDQDIDSRTRAVFRECLKSLVVHKTVITWNAQADLPVMEKNLGINLGEPIDTGTSVKSGSGAGVLPPQPHPGTRFEDGMLAHACLWCELPHDLEFAASVYSDYVKPKKEVVGWGLGKNWGDVVATLECWRELEKSLKADPGAMADYLEQRLPLVSILLAAHKRGLRVNKPRVLAAIPEYREKMDAAQAIVEVCTGWPLSLGSPTQLAHWLYVHEGLSPQKNRKTKKTTVDDDAVAVLRAAYHPAPDFEEEKDGVTTDYIEKRVEAGAHPALEGRVLYAGAKQVLSHYLLPLMQGGDKVVDRIYPSINQHTQDNRRWSTSDPPLSQLPDDLRNIVIPDEGEYWIKWDWDAAEPRMQMAVMRSRFLENVLNKGWDVNTIALCDLMGWTYPSDRAHPELDLSWFALHKWGGKDDPRRRIAKAGRLAMDYGKRDLSDLPGAYVLGLPKHVLKQGGDLILRADPDKRRWMGEVRAKVRKGENVSRDWTGARRVFLGTKRDGLVRQWLNHPMQSGVSSLLNATIVQLHYDVPKVSLAWSMHDAVWLHCPADAFEAVLPKVKDIVEQERNICGYRTKFPATWHVIHAS
jgi:DNA polymerase I-like protein with 3'-5' exonuclease and polymerase domains